MLSLATFSYANLHTQLQQLCGELNVNANVACKIPPSLVMHISDGRDGDVSAMCVAAAR